jgi:glycosyltransferase involved in cell wall biosynthesis
MVVPHRRVWFKIESEREATYPMTALSVLILTGNEEKNIVKCLRSLAPLGAKVHIVDSESTDRTVEIARSMGATVHIRPWTTYADQFNWGLDHAGIDTPWTMRMDADEEVTPGLAAALRKFIEAPPSEVSGVYVRRQVHFLGRWIRHGGYYPTWLLRVFRSGQGRCETLFMDEHIVLSQGQSISIPEDIVDKNNKDLSFWTNKHNSYASREVKDILNKEAALKSNVKQAGVLTATVTGRQDAVTRWMKHNLYLRMPLFVRPCLYFIYRYFVRLGFLDGVQGLIFHFLQAFWYRFLVDAKLYEHRYRQRNPDA